MNNSIKTYIIWSIDPDTTSVRDFVSLDTRTREIWHKSWHTNYEPVQLTVVREYASSNGTEYFISIEDQMGYLYGFTRLCCPIEWGIADRPGLGEWTAMIRELHVYWQLASLEAEKGWIVVNSKEGLKKLKKADGVIIEPLEVSWTLLSQRDSLHVKPLEAIKEVQHTGLGRQLMSLAEQISIKKWYHTLSVISWIWVRWYYQKLGYKLVGSYMVKSL